MSAAGDVKKNAAQTPTPGKPLATNAFGSSAAADPDDDDDYERPAPATRANKGTVKVSTSKAFTKAGSGPDFDTKMDNKPAFPGGPGGGGGGGNSKVASMNVREVQIVNSIPVMIKASSRPPTQVGTVSYNGYLEPNIVTSRTAAAARAMTVHGPPAYPSARSDKTFVVMPHTLLFRAVEYYVRPGTANTNLPLSQKRQHTGLFAAFNGLPKSCRAVYAGVADIQTTPAGLNLDSSRPTSGSGAVAVVQEGIRALPVGDAQVHAGEDVIWMYPTAVRTSENGIEPHVRFEGSESDGFYAVLGPVAAFKENYEGLALSILTGQAIPPTHDRELADVQALVADLTKATAMVSGQEKLTALANVHHRITHYNKHHSFESTPTETQISDFQKSYSHFVVATTEEGKIQLAQLDMATKIMSLHHSMIDGRRVGTAMQSGRNCRVDVLMKK